MTKLITQEQLTAQYDAWRARKLTEVEPPLEANNRRAEENRIASGAAFPTREQFHANDCHALYNCCRIAKEDLASVEAEFGRHSAEYKAKLTWAFEWVGVSLPWVLNRAINDLIRHGHDEPPQRVEIV